MTVFPTGTSISSPSSGFSFIDVITTVAMFAGFNESEKWKDKDDKYDLSPIKYSLVFLWTNGTNVLNYNAFCALHAQILKLFHDAIFFKIAFDTNFTFNCKRVLISSDPDPIFCLFKCRFFFYSSIFFYSTNNKLRPYLKPTFRYENTILELWKL